MNAIEKRWRAERATIILSRDKSWDDILLVKPAEKKGGYVKVGRRKESDGGYHRKTRP